MHDEKPVFALVAEANRIAERESIFWRVDHPPDSHVNHVAPAEPTSAVEACRVSLVGAERVLSAARRQLERAQEAIDDACHRAGTNCEGHLPAAVMRVIKFDVRRARSEVEHWKEYVAHFEAAHERPPQNSGFLSIGRPGGET